MSDVIEDSDWRDAYIIMMMGYDEINHLEQWHMSSLSDVSVTLCGDGARDELGDPDLGVCHEPARRLTIIGQLLIDPTGASVSMQSPLLGKRN